MSTQIVVNNWQKYHMKKAQSRETGPCWGNPNAGRSRKQQSERDSINLLFNGSKQLGLEGCLLGLDPLLFSNQQLHLL